MQTAIVALLVVATACSRSSAPSVPARARAIVVEKFGDAPALETVAVPRPAPGEVLVAVRAIGVNPVDALAQAGEMRDLTKHVPPLTPGYDISGVVAAVGAGVRAVRVGDEVHGMLSLDRGGAYADYTLALETELAAKPARLGHVEAAAMPLTALTAWQALERGPVRAGQRVLIHGGAGGVGTMAIQLAKARGAYVIATASAQNLDHVRSLGADVAIDYRAQRFEEVAGQVDFVLDAIGGDTQARSWPLITKGGILVSLVQPPRTDVDGVRGAWFLVTSSGDQLREIDALVSRGAVKPVVTTVLPLAEASHAQQLLRTTHSRGKIVLTP